MKLMSFGFIGGLGLGGHRPAGRRRGRLAVQLLHTTDWGRLDDLIVDAPPGTGEIPRALAARRTTVVVSS